MISFWISVVPPKIGWPWPPARRDPGLITSPAA